MKTEKLTPQTIVDGSYSIPIYQRLFEWDTENILTLLSDLKHSFVESSGKDDYYIGMLTSTKEHELVDGQQRFVVMMLLGCVLKKYYTNWENFIQSQEKPRLSFTSRPKDNAYLEALIKGSPITDEDWFKTKMYNGIEQITLFFDSDSLSNNEQKKNFAKYIYEHLAFFISELPENYSPTDLNMYFERMNTTGKNLEQHEILKVKMLRHLDESSLYMQLWNGLADVDTLLIKRRNGEKNKDLYNRKKEAIQADCVQKTLDILDLKGNDNDEIVSIAYIAPSTTKPISSNAHIHNSYGLLTFPQLLLQTLYYWYPNKEQDKKDIDINKFFNPSNLLETFGTYLPYEGDKEKLKDDIKSFMENLLKYRLILDICFVRPTENGYSLDMNLPDDEEEEEEDDEKNMNPPNDDKEKEDLLMFESMLFVSSSNYTNYRWFGWLMSFFESNQDFPSADKLYNYLKKKDDDFRGGKQPNSEGLSYERVDRYWFWRLDYYLWENREKIFVTEEARKIANNYVFRRNRSIEHIVPQTPKTESDLKWIDKDFDESSLKDTEIDEVRAKIENWQQSWADLWDSLDDEEKKIADRIIRNSFGNLAMISSGLNSSLSNESYEVKRAHVASYCNSSVHGSIESLNLLWVYEKYNIWNEKTFRCNIINHEKEMINVLKKSFNENRQDDNAEGLSQDSPN